MTPYLADERTDAEIAALEVWACATYGNVSVRFTEGVKGRTKRRYLVSIDGGPEKNLPSVTTILGKHITKDLDYYHEQTAYDAATEIIADVLSEIGGDIDEITNAEQDALRTFSNLAKPGKIGGAAYAMGLTPRQIRDDAGLDGNLLHSAMQGWFEDGQVPDLAQVPQGKRGKMVALIKFLNDVRPRLIAAEPPIVSTLYGYTGRPDLICEVDRHVPVKVQTTLDKNEVHDGWLPPGIHLLDAKSGNKIWNNHGVQIAMYEQGCDECNFPEIEWRTVLHLRDGEYVIHVFPDMRSLIPHLMPFYTGFKSLNRQKSHLNKSLLIEPEPAEAVA